MTADADDRLHRVRAIRGELHAAGPKRSRPFNGDFERVALPAADCKILRDTLVAHRARVVIEAGLAYGSPALAIGEALCSTGGTDVSHIVIDPFQATGYDNVRPLSMAAIAFTKSLSICTFSENSFGRVG